MLVSLDHVIIGVRDRDAAAESYRALLGRAPSWRGQHPGLGTGNVLFRLANTYLELLAPIGDGFFAQSLGARLEEEGEGVIGIAFGTDDAEAAGRELRARRLKVGDPVDGQGLDELTGAVRKWRNVMFPEDAMRGVFAFAIEHLSPPDALPLARSTDDARACVAGLDHLVIHSADADASKAVYADTLGIRLALDKSFEAFGARLLFFRIGGITVEIGARLGAPPLPDEPDRFGGLAYQVADVRAAHKRLVEQGVQVSDVRTGRKPGTLVCTVHDPTHGVPTLFIGRDGL